MVSTECKKNKHVLCDNPAKCASCGWTKEVSQQRLHTILAARERQRQAAARNRAKAAPDGTNIEDGRPKGQI